MVRQKTTMGLTFFTILCIILQSPVLASSIECTRVNVSPNSSNGGFIHSPNYPWQYPASICYIWFYTVPKESKVVITIQDLDIPSVDNCRSKNSNRLIIGPIDRRLYCGNLHSDIKYEATVSDYFYIALVISEPQTPRGRGFYLRYQLNPPDSLPKIPASTQKPDTTQSIAKDFSHLPKGTDLPCRFSTIESNGVITIPKAILPNELRYHYNDGEKSCSWLLQTPTYMGPLHAAPIYRYALRFQNFHFYPDCCALDIYEGASDANGRRIAHYFGESHPHSLYALGPQVYMRLTFNKDSYFGNFTIQFQREELCLNGYEACKYNESGCYPVSKRCDGVWDCPLKGGDERGCTSSCSDHNFSCGNTSTYCFSEQDRCNGNGACANYRDEQNCTPSQCSPDKGLFLCLNKRCIFEKWQCDHADDCGDGSDEENCDRLSSPRLIIACVVGTLISSLLLVLALSFAMKVYAHRTRRRHGDLHVQHDSPLSRIEEDLLRRRAPPPQYNEAMMTSRSFDEAYLELLNQGQVNNGGDNVSAQEGASTSNGSSSNTTHGASSQRGRGRRNGNRRRGGSDRRLHRNLRIQRQRQHLHGCAPLIPPPPVAQHSNLLNFFTEQPPSYSDAISDAAAESLTHIADNNPITSPDLSSSDGRSHELQPMSSVAISPPSTSTNATAESIPPPYSLHNDLHSDDSGSDDNDIDEDDDDIDDDDDMIDISEDGYVNSNYASATSRRSLDDDDDECLLLRRDGNDDDEDDIDDQDEEDDTCLSVIPESTHSHMLSFSVPPLLPNTTISSDLMTATELAQISTILKEDSDEDCGDDGDADTSGKKEERRVENTKDGKEESEQEALSMPEEVEDSRGSSDASVSESSQSDGKFPTCDSNESNGSGEDDDVECISVEAAVLENNNECCDVTSDTACLLPS